MLFAKLSSPSIYPPFVATDTPRKLLEVVEYSGTISKNPGARSGLTLERNQSVLPLLSPSAVFSRFINHKPRLGSSSSDR